MAGVYGWAAAQIAKVPTHKVKKGVWELSQLVAAGGMPSSHSALCMVRFTVCDPASCDVRPALPAEHLAELHSA